MAFDWASLSLLAERLGLFDGRSLRIVDGLASSANVGAGFAAGLAADQLPGAVDDLLLQLGELLGLLGVAALLLAWLFLARRGLLALAEDLLEVADLGEVHVARGPPRLAVGADVLGPEKVGHKLVGLGLERLEVDQVLGVRRLRCRGRSCPARSRSAPARRA